MIGERKFENLSRVEILKDLDRDELLLLSNYCQMVRLKSDETIIKEGQRVSFLYIVMKGELRVFLPKGGNEGKEKRISEVRLNVLSEGDCLGEYSLIAKMPASASIIATEPCELLKIPEDQFDRILMENDRLAKVIYRNMLRILIERLQEREREYDLISVIG